MDFKGIVDKAKSALHNDPSLIDKGGDAVDKVTGGKYAGQVDKAQDAVRKAVGNAEDKADKAVGNEPGNGAGNEPQGKPDAQ